MYTELHATERACLPIGGGLKALSIVDPNDLASQPAWNIIPNVAALDFKPGKTAWLFEPDLLTGSLSGDTNVSGKSGDVFSYRLDAKVRNNRLDVDYLRAKLIGRRVHVVGTYQDGAQRFVPWMRLYATDKSGTKRSDHQGYDFSGQAQLITPAPFLAGTITVTGGLPPDPGPGFTGGGVTIIPTTTTDPTYTYIVPAGKILAAVYVKSDSPQTVSLGTSALGEQLGGPIPLAALQYALLGDNLLRAETDTTIYLSGMAGTNSIEIWLLG